jgi:hypothetical protein
MCFFSFFKWQNDHEKALDQALRKASCLSDKNEDEQNQWCKDYSMERWRGIANLQRQRRLQQIQSELQHSTRDDKGSEEPPKYSDANTAAQLDEELRQLHLKYSQHLRYLDKLSHNRVQGCFSEGYLTLYHHWDENNRSYGWRSYRTRCADKGGCCSRSCGCCEKPLRVSIRPNSENDEKETVRTHGHCTSECPCCNQYWGSYGPYPGLPETAFKQVPSQL